MDASLLACSNIYVCLYVCVNVCVCIYACISVVYVFTCVFMNAANAHKISFMQSSMTPGFVCMHICETF